MVPLSKRVTYRGRAVACSPCCVCVRNAWAILLCEGLFVGIVECGSDGWMLWMGWAGLGWAGLIGYTCAKEAVVGGLSLDLGAADRKGGCRMGRLRGLLRRRYHRMLWVLWVRWIRRSGLRGRRYAAEIEVTILNRSFFRVVWAWGVLALVHGGRRYHGEWVVWFRSADELA